MEDRCCAFCNNASQYVDKSDGKIWCNKWDEYKYPEHCCYSFERGRSSYQAEEIIKESKRIRGPVNTDCYITTMLCHILGYKDNDVKLMTLRKLRDKVMQKDASYRRLLAEYDEFGPAIAEKLNEDNISDGDTSKAFRICTNLDRMVITKAANLVDEGKYSEAIELYKDMYYLLLQGYGIDNSGFNPTNEEVSNIPDSLLGHGKPYIFK